MGLCLTLGGLRHRTQDIQQYERVPAVVRRATTLSFRDLPNGYARQSGNFSLLQPAFAEGVA